MAAFDDDEENPGQLLFQVKYCDGDDEWMSATELESILVPEHEVVRK